MSEAAKGVLAMVAACTIWGLGPIYWKLLAHVPAIDVIAQRTLWSAVTFVLILAFQRRLTVLWAALRHPRVALTVFLAALMISLNWFTFVWAVGNGRTVEASLGYFLFPLVAVIAGRVIFKEHLGALQKLAVGLAAFAVVVLTVGLGVLPWIALVLAASFGLYGVIKKGLDMGPVVSVTGEVLLLSPLALFLILTSPSGTGGLGNAWQDAALLVFSGVFTATPLILFSYAARRAPLSTVGLVQYLNPTLQFFCAVAIFGEPFGFWHAVSFPMIWVSLAIYTYASLRQEKLRKRAASKASTSSTT
ncbi:chloramphenicol-sensitive protein RarD [Shimia gijangensis]|uniref:Chloramphenicol-sensitive protein RarD n=1 Tax=Shimia gijangensis TaxID=1470563 RepID=A0A1M6E6W5_9RHOB|nr:EamA family transporter RarD [Shimia gijangensis]SHI81274.1 chloramphenicol-sensitive protein RarD [Shimia gijangensis]